MYNLIILKFYQVLRQVVIDVKTCIMVVLNLKTKLIKQNKVEFKSRSSIHCLNYHC